MQLHKECDSSAHPTEAFILTSAAGPRAVLEVARNHCLRIAHLLVARGDGLDLDLGAQTTGRFMSM